MHSQSEPRTLAAVKAPISREALDQLFREARTHSTWLPEPVPVELLRKAYELARLGPTSANASPARFVFLTTPGAKALLKPVLAPGNVDKTMAAPVTVIIAWDTEFHEHLPKLFPQADIRDRKSTRLNSSHGYISYAVFCLKKKTTCCFRVVWTTRRSSTSGRTRYSSRTQRPGSRPRGSRRGRRRAPRTSLHISSNEYRRS